MQAAATANAIKTECQKELDEAGRHRELVACGWFCRLGNSKCPLPAKSDASQKATERRPQLAQALPEYYDAIKALDSLDKKDIQEARS